MIKAILLFVCATLLLFLQSCESKKTERYIVLGTGEKFAAFLDTQTNEVYSVQNIPGGKPDIFKTSLEEANKNK